MATHWPKVEDGYSKAYLLPGGTKLENTVQAAFDAAAAYSHLGIPLSGLWIRLWSGDQTAGLSRRELLSLPDTVHTTPGSGIQQWRRGFGILTDILSGYFDKLLLTPINRFAILFSSLFTASIRALVQTALIVILALALGVSFKTGPLGVFVVIWFVATFGVAWACLGIAIALKTKSAEITQSYFVLFFPAVFLTTGFMPKEFLPGWFKVMASINPVTYVMESTRVMVVQGWDGSTILPGLLVLIALTGGLMGITTWLFHRATV
jgi:ABC-type uncharacterized transport system permease subunit